MFLYELLYGDENSKSNVNGSRAHGFILLNKNNNEKSKTHLPAHVRGLPLQNVLGER